ncbi:hypothetical protein EDC01DRAFT_751487, partial [Geopyxis carbonaria]
DKSNPRISISSSSSLFILSSSSKSNKSQPGISISSSSSSSPLLLLALDTVFFVLALDAFLLLALATPPLFFPRLEVRLLHFQVPPPFLLPYSPSCVILLRPLRSRRRQEVRDHARPGGRGGLADPESGGCVVVCGCVCGRLDGLGLAARTVGAGRAVGRRDRH